MRARVTAVDDQKINELIGTIYESVVDPKAWDTALKRLSMLMPARTSVVWCQDLTSGAFPVFRGTIDPDALALYAAYYADLDVWVQRGKGLFRPGQAVLSDNYVPREELHRTEFYNDYCKKFGFDQVMSGMLANSSDRFGALALFRSEREAPFDATELRVMGTVTPHAQRALRLGQKMRDLQARQSLISEALHEGSVALLILDRNASVIFANARAEAILRAADGFTVRADRLLVSDRVSGSAFSRLIGASSEADRASCEWGGSLAVPRPSGRAPYLVSVVPLRVPDRGPTWSVLVTIEEPEPEPLPEPYLRQRYGLSRGEARVVFALSKGESLESIAANQDVSLHTVETMLRRAMRKTGVHRRSDLIRLCMR